jgi:RNA polymerase sigma factor (sigma-70 family)
MEKTKPFQPIVLSSICRSIAAGEGMAVHVRGSIPKRSTIKEDLDARFRASLVAYFLRRTGSPQEAEDLTQETFVRLIGSNTFEDAQTPHAYVFRVASNLLRDRARSTTRLQRFPALSIDALPNPDYEPKLVEGLDPERVLIARENLSEVLACLDELGERTKSIFILFRLEGMKQKGIAAIYGISHSTVEKHVMAAVLHLAKRFRTIR